MTLTVNVTAPSSQRARWAITSKLINDERLLLHDIQSGDTNTRVVSTPPIHIADPDGHTPHNRIMKLNDALSELSDRHPGRIFSLATINAYDGDRAAGEVERVVNNLGFKGIFVESACGDMLIDAPQARPALAAAARLKIPVFVHPINPQPFYAQMEPYGRVGTLFARGTVNAAALLSLIEGGVFIELPELQVVVTCLAFGGLAMSEGCQEFSRLSAETLGAVRKNIYVDTMGFSPTLIRASVDLLGANNVLAGSDWPIANDKPIRSRLEHALSRAGLTTEQQLLIAGANALRLLGMHDATS